MFEKEINVEVTKFYIIAWILLIIAVILLYNGYWIGWICYYLSFGYSVADVITDTNDPPHMGPGEPPKAA